MSIETLGLIGHIGAAAGFLIFGLIIAVLLAPVVYDIVNEILARRRR